MPLFLSLDGPRVKGNADLADTDEVRTLLPHGFAGYGDGTLRVADRIVDKD